MGLNVTWTFLLTHVTASPGEPRHSHPLPLTLHTAMEGRQWLPVNHVSHLPGIPP